MASLSAQSLPDAAAADPHIMAYAQWVTIIIINSSTKAIVVKNVRRPWGKFHKDGNKDDEIPIEKIENTKIPSGEVFKINSCGRSSVASGTEGEFDICEDGSEKVAHFYWSCPWGSKVNTWKITEHNPKWLIENSGANIDSGALGTITVSFYKTEPLS